MKKYFLLFSFLIFLSCNNSNGLKSSEMPEEVRMQNQNTFLSMLELPDSLDFCGERIPMEIEEVRERVEREFYLILQDPGQVILYFKRSGRYFPVFEKAIKEMGVPEDLKYLSVAESALYMSRSTRGALGLWQFIASTGSSMGLEINDYVDERLDPEKSTYSALKYLQNGYKQHKSWISAAAGYNMGNGGVVENMTFQQGKDFFDLFLNEETSRYIFRIVCIKEIMQHPDKYGFIINKSKLYKPDEVRLVRVTAAIPNLSTWAQQYKTTYKNVKLLNRWILKRELPAPANGKYYEIAIPKS